ncbi:organic solvent tolerance protein [Bdellovibrio sp. HCB337]|uniref:organic solvent tolerance protein n=1 Tax=Bdellovibrio sp. HCB337 TaxID=3394358 RepID=UPI0039A6A069
MRLTAAFLSILVATSLFSNTASAKELANRLGIGVKNDTSINIPSMAVSYYPTPEIGLTGGLGIDTRKDNSAFSLNGGVRRIIFKEDNMNFFMGGELGLINQEIATDKQSGFYLSGLFGAEFFFAGLENLSFSFQGGVGVVSLDDVRFRTIGDSPFQAAVIFYF